MSMQVRFAHDRVAATFLFFGAVLPIVLTFGLVYFMPQLYDEGVRTATPWIAAMREKVAETHDPRALNAFDVALGGGALFSMYLGLAVGRVLGPIQKLVEHLLATHGRAPSQDAQRP
jgi:hypothetical protein